jgi:hypothetical protein
MGQSTGVLRRADTFAAMFRVTAFSLLWLLSATCAAQDTAYVRKMVARLCDPMLHGRGYFHDGDQAAAYEIEQEMRSMGLRSFDNDYYQEFRFGVNTFPGAMELKADSVALVPGHDFIVGDDAPSVRGTFRCEAAGALGKLAADGAYTGLPFGPGTALALPDSLLPPHGPMRERLMTSLKAANLGALIIITPKKLTWSVSTAQGILPTFTVLQDRWPVQVGFVKLKIEAEFVRKHLARNVVGWIEGKEKPKEFIVITAHYDHLGRMGKETIFPGANDNASGTAMLLDMARHYAKDENRPDRSMVFMAFAGEEAGLLGSSFYVQSPLFPLSDIRFLVNLDLLGTGEEGITVVNGSVHAREFDLLKEINAEYGLVPQVKARGKAANSDHYPFSEMGVPAFFIYAMGPRKAYHDVDDVPGTLTFAGYDGIYRLISRFMTQLP